MPSVPSYGYDSNDRMAGDTYDDNGNTITSNGLTYGYDFENRLVSRNGSPALAFVYDHDGNRVRKNVAGVTTYFLVDEQKPNTQDGCVGTGADSGGSPGTVA